jgi:hypothetical protein
MPYLRWLVTGFPPWWPRLEPRPGHVGFVMDKVALKQVFYEYFGYFCQFSFHQLLSTDHQFSFRAGTIGQIVANIPN